MMPFERVDAELLRRKYSAKRFFCGEWLGGCGKELYTRIGPVRVPHFAHHPESSDGPVNCRRSSTDEQSADHLYIRQELTDWLRRCGHQIKAVHLEGSVPREGGSCTGMTIETAKGGLIAVALRNDLREDSNGKWPQRDAQLRRSHRSVEWLFAPSVPMVRHMTKRQGHAFVVGCETDGLRRIVKIGTKVGGKIPLWANLQDCTIDERGRVRTPHLAELPRNRTTQAPYRPSTAEPANTRAASIEKPKQGAAVPHPLAAVGFAVHEESLTLIPRSGRTMTHREIDADIACTDFVLPTTSVRVIIAEADSAPLIGRSHIVAGPALLSATSPMGSAEIVWKLQVQDLVLIPADDADQVDEESKEPAQTNPDAWARTQAILATLEYAETQRDADTWAGLYEEVEALMERLGATERSEADQRLNRQRNIVREAEIERERSSEPAKMRSGKPPKAIPLPAPTSARSRPRASKAAHVDRNQVAILFGMIEQAVSQRKLREAREVCQALERFLDGLPPAEYQEELDRLTKRKRRLGLR
ncbi:competence protein CoiA family protein [Nonomuraea sp. CA-143628]|uniref:competence protein CoiA family protein n=1 Tax=Nonomuraea sp. CA-143628 TaxID=3239997 RepID=UPI003D8F0403